MNRWLRGLTIGCFTSSRSSNKSSRYTDYSTIEDCYEKFKSPVKTIDRGRFSLAGKFRFGNKNTRGLFRFSGTKMDRECTAKQLRNERQELESCWFKETELMKRRGRDCAIDRPRICVCTCDQKRLSADGSGRGSTGSEDRPNSGTSWVYQSDDENYRQLSSQSNRRIEKMFAL
ncbi:uncharacterized protein LOC131694089 [Topomyia yanbarensis]|uniref:uncharacterized protein LOC131694089 n=1 Tax=Topomyia yanbarensis TaxID=2498891 RepID=UPI00273BF082|nr:uncharacterized protein LOC131694089 [Topomyia yanbarensis]